VDTSKLKIYLKLLITVNIMCTSAYSECISDTITKPTTGNSRSVASKVESIDKFITDRSAEVGEGIYLKSDKERQPTDDRLVKTKDSPRYLDAVGKLRIIKQDGSAEICGASLVAFIPKQNSRIVVTSLHCLKTNRMTWATTTKDGKTIKRNIKEVVYDDRKSDYAFLLLDDFVDYKDVTPLLIDYNRSSSIISHMSEGHEFAVAGYSADAEVGQGGNVLTYDNNGRLAAMDRDGDPIGGGSEEITTYGGASGGAVIVNFEVDEDYAPGLIEGKQAFLFGIIKGGITNDFTSDNGVQGSNNTRFVTYEKFILPLKETMIKYNGQVDGIDDELDWEIDF
jgi:hypothetical protein